MTKGVNGKLLKIFMVELGLSTFCSFTALDFLSGLIMAGSLRGHSGEQFWKHGWGMVKSLSSVQANAWLFKEVQSSCYKYQIIWMQAVFVFCCFCNKLPRNLSLKGTQMYYLGALEARSPKASTGLHSFWGSGENLPGPLPASRDCADFPALSPPPSSKPLAWYPFSSLTSTFILTSPSDLSLLPSSCEDPCDDVEPAQ